jgi:hypothetical protein
VCENVSELETHLAMFYNQIPMLQTMSNEEKAEKIQKRVP